MDRSSYTDTDRLRFLIEQSGLDALVATAPENVTHTSGYYNLDQRLLPEHLHACLWTAEGDPVLVIPSRERLLESFVADVRGYTVYSSAEEGGATLLAGALAERGLGSGRIGVDLSHLSARHYLALRSRLPDALIVDATDLLSRSRLVKTPAEIDLIRRAAVATERAIAIGYAQARPGDTEKSVVDAMDCFCERLGAEIVGFNVMASGPRTVLGHHRAEPVSISPGDLLRVDYGGLFDGYFTDLVRMAVVGAPSERQRSTYSRCHEVHRRLLMSLRPGVSGGTLYEQALRGYRDVGLPLTRSMFGHGIGLTVHERPLIGAGEEWALEPGMVLCLENGVTLPEQGERYHLEDMVAITAEGFELLSGYSDAAELYIIP